MSWTRNTDMNWQGARDQETWIRQEADGKIEHFPVSLYLGKKTDLLSLKSNVVQSIQDKLAYYAESRTRLYSEETAKEYVVRCPVTGIGSDKCQTVANIYGAEYIQSPDTGHVFVKNRPTQRAISNFYLSDTNYASTYTNKDAAESRLSAIAVPWLEWTVEVYKAQYGKNPERILDVGSGAGHFVEACRRGGIDAQGIELSEASRQFARDIWGFEMYGDDFTEVHDRFAGFDIVTFWGLLEHTPNPGSILEAAHKVVKASPNGGMVISKLPRWLSLSSAAQRVNSETIIRHIDPMGHIMLFTDASAAELYVRNGFKPVAAWYYGMDIYELLMQTGHSASDYTCLTQTAEKQVLLQQFVDESRFSDGITLVGIPKSH